MRRLVIFLLVVLGLLVAADRVAAVVASHAIADDVAKDESQCAKPGVDIAGFPFLTQAIAGRYGKVTLTTTCEDDGRTFFDPVTVTLHGVHVPLGDVVHGSVQRVPVDHATATAMIPFAVLDRRVGAGELRFSRGPNRTIVITGTITVAGHSVSASGAAQVTVSQGSLHFGVATVKTPVGSVPGTGLSTSLALPALPFHLRSVSASASDTGVVITATAAHIVLTR